MQQNAMYLILTLIFIIIFSIILKLLANKMANDLFDLIYGDDMKKLENKLDKKFGLLITNEEESVKCWCCGNTNVDKGCKCHNCGEIV